jgi:hypothetical protein
MKQDYTRTEERREFLRDGVRYSILGGFAWFGLVYGLRRPLSPNGLSGLSESPCRDCSRLRGCRKRLARQFRAKKDQKKVSACPDKKETIDG